MQEEIEQIIKDNTKIKIKENYYLSNKQVSALIAKNVPYDKCNNTKELIFILQEYLSDEELDEIGLEIDELNYYNYTNK